MRIRVCHTTTYAYLPPARLVTQILRLTPRSHESQRVLNWRIDLDADCALRAADDAFGNITHSFSAVGPLSRIAVEVAGEVQTFDTSGVARGVIERFPPETFLRTTPLTQPDEKLRALARDVASKEDAPLARLHLLMARLSEALAFDTKATQSQTTAAQAMSIGRGVCQDFAHVFIACAREMGVPARYVSGYFLHLDGPTDQDAGHAWAEAYVDNLGWVGFDAANNVCPGEAHVSLARGLDYLGAAPVRGARAGGGQEMMSVTLRVEKI